MSSPPQMSNGSFYSDISDIIIATPISQCNIPLYIEATQIDTCVCGELIIEGIGVIGKCVTCLLE